MGPPCCYRRAASRAALTGLLMGVALVLTAFDASSQERLQPPDSLRTRRSPFFMPSFSPAPSLLLADPRPADRYSTFGPPGLLVPGNSAWRRAFLTGGGPQGVDILQPYLGVLRKRGWFQQVQVALGAATLAGASYLGYRAVAKKPVTKKSGGPPWAKTRR